MHAARFNEPPSDEAERIQSAEIYFADSGWRVGRGERMLFMVSGRVLEYTEDKWGSWKAEESERAREFSVG